MDTTFFKYALDSIKDRKLRSTLTMLGIIVGVASIIALISIGQGLENAVNDQFEKMGVNDIRVLPGSLRGPPVGKAGLTTDDVDVVEMIRGIEYVTPMLMSSAKIEFNHEEKYTTFAAYPLDVVGYRFADTDIKPVEGRFFEKGDMHDVIIGYNIAHNFFDRKIMVKNKVKIKDVDFRVIGIVEETGLSNVDNMLVIPMDAGRELTGKKDEVNIILAHVRDGFSAEAVAEDIIKKLKRSRGNENFEVFTPEQLLAQIGSVIGIVQTVLVGIAAISLLVGGIGIMNTMYTSVLERVREIGVMKAIGARNFDILMIFLFEAGMLGAVGGIIGIVFGSVGALIVGVAAKFMGFPLLLIRIDPIVVIGGLAFAFVVGCAAGAIPSWNASRLKPVDSLRYE